MSAFMKNPKPNSLQEAMGNQEAQVKVQGKHSSKEAGRAAQTDAPNHPTNNHLV